MDDQFLTVADIARILKLNQQTVRNWIDRGELPAYRLGRRVRVSRRDFDAFAELGYKPDPFQTGGRAAPGIWEPEMPAPTSPDVSADAVDDRR